MPIDLRKIKIKINPLRNPKKYLHNSPSDAQQVTLDPPGNPGITTTQIDVPSFEGRTTTLITEKSLSPSFPTIIGSFDFIPLFNQDKAATEAFEFFLLQLQMRITVMALVTRAIGSPEYGVATNSQGGKYATIVTEIRASLVALLRYWLAFIALYETLDFKSKSDALIPDNRINLTIPSEFFEDIQSVYSSLYDSNWLDDNNPNSLTGYWNEILSFDPAAFLSMSSSSVFAQIAAELSNNISYNMPYLESRDDLISLREDWEPEDSYDNYNIVAQEDAISGGQILYKELKSLRTDYISALRNTWGFGMPKGFHSRTAANPRKIFSSLISVMPEDPAQVVSLLMWFLQSECVISSKNVGTTDEGESSLATAIKENLEAINPDGDMYRANNFSGFDYEDSDSGTTGDSIRSALVDTIGSRALDVFTDSVEESVAGLTRITTSEGDSVLIFENSPSPSVPSAVTDALTDAGGTGVVISGREYFLQDIAEGDGALSNFGNYVTHYSGKITNLNALLSNLYSPHMVYTTMLGSRTAADFISPGGADGSATTSPLGGIRGEIKDKTGASAILSMLGWLFRNWLITVSQAESQSYFGDAGFDLDIVTLSAAGATEKGIDAMQHMRVEAGVGKMYFSSASGTMTSSRAMCSGHFELCLLKLCCDDSDAYNAFLEWLVTKYTWIRVSNADSSLDGTTDAMDVMYGDMSYAPNPGAVTRTGKGSNYGLMNINAESATTDFGLTSIKVDYSFDWSDDVAFGHESLLSSGFEREDMHNQGFATFRYDSLNLASMKLASMIHKSCVDNSTYQSEKDGYSGTTHTAKLRNLVAVGATATIEVATELDAAGIDLDRVRELYGEDRWYGVGKAVSKSDHTELLVFSPVWSATLNPIMTYLSECLTSLGDQPIASHDSATGVCSPWIDWSTQMDTGIRAAPTLSDLPRWLLYLGRVGYYRTCIDIGGGEAAELDGSMADPSHIGSFSFSGTRTLAISPRYMGANDGYGSKNDGEARWPHKQNVVSERDGAEPVYESVAEKEYISGKTYMTRCRGILDQHYIVLAGILLVNAFKLLGLADNYFRFTIDGESDDRGYPRHDHIWYGPGDDWRSYAYAVNGTGAALDGYYTEILYDEDTGRTEDGDFYVHTPGRTSFEPSDSITSTGATSGAERSTVYVPMIIGNTDRHGLMNLKCATKISNIDSKIEDLGKLIGISMFEETGYPETLSGYATKQAFPLTPSLGACLMLLE